MKTQTKILFGVGVVATVGYILWQQQLNKKKNLVGLAPIQYEFKNFSSLSPEISFQESNRLPNFGVPIRIKNR